MYAHCVCMYMRVHMYTCLHWCVCSAHACVPVCMCMVCVYLGVYVCMRAHAVCAHPVCACTCVHVYGMCLCRCACAHACVCMQVCMCAHAVCASTCACMCACVHWCVYSARACVRVCMCGATPASQAHPRPLLLEPESGLALDPCGEHEGGAGGLAPARAGRCGEVRLPRTEPRPLATNAGSCGSLCRLTRSDTPSRASHPAAGCQPL